MAVITAQGSGNWDAGGTWTGGVVPGNGDTADLNGFDVTMNIATIPAAGVLTAITSAGSAGTLVIGSVAGANTINATNLTGGSKGTAGTFQYSGIVCDSLTINGNITGCAAGGTNPYALVKSSTKALTINGDLTGGAVTNAHALYLSGGQGTTTINGDVTASSTAYGIYRNASATLAINCDAITAVGAYPGVYNGNTAGDITIGPLAPGTSVTLTGTARSGAISNIAASQAAITISSDCFMDNTVGTSYYGASPTWAASANEMITQKGPVKFAPLVAAADLKSGVVNGDIFGTLVSGGGGGAVIGCGVICSKAA